MTSFTFPRSLAGYPVHMVGIKGTGMTALAEYLSGRGARLSGSDTEEKFYTDEILASLGIPYREGFDAANLPADAALVVYSAAYSPDANPELLEARRRGIPVVMYTDALGAVSGLSASAGIAGVHGKTTTTALVGALVKAAELPASVIAGSAVSSFGGRSTLLQGDRYFIAETCEYRRHFLAFHPRWIVLTSVEPDHLDYFSGYADILEAFVSYGRLLPEGGALVYCADDPGAVEAAGILASSRPDIRYVPYGERAEGRFAVGNVRSAEGRTVFTLAGFPGEFAVRIPGLHTVKNAAAAFALVTLILETERGRLSDQDLSRLRAGLLEFAGSKRRSEILGEAGGVLFMDDYAHHPTAIRTTLEGLRAFYPGRRIVADFMSHTYSRTRALLGEFASSFDAADLVVLHRIYASARETDTSGITGRDLYELARSRYANVVYIDDPDLADEELLSRLAPGDLFITLGAGDNWKLGRRLFERLSGRSGSGREPNREASGPGRTNR